MNVGPPTDRPSTEGPPSAPSAPPAPGASPANEPAGPLLPAASFRTRLEDFMVEEIPAYEPEGRGGHAFVRFRKTDVTTLDAVRSLALALETDPRQAGFAGMKDRRAITEQTASFALPESRDLASALAGLSVPGVEVLSATRHPHKLKTGHLQGNRFDICLRDLDPAALPKATAALDEIRRTGVPNAFGPQRFGRHGDNATRALEWIAGQWRGPRDKKEKRLLFSAAQSLLFNRVLDRRIAEGTWAGVLPGDIAKKHETGGLFVVPADGDELDDARQRAAAGLLSATGPMFGAKMRWPEGPVLELEREILHEAIADTSRLDALRSVGEGTRRSLRLWVADLKWTADAAEGSLRVSFVLSKGGYATTVLGQVCRLEERR